MYKLLRTVFTRDRRDIDMPNNYAKEKLKRQMAEYIINNLDSLPVVFTETETRFGIEYRLELAIVDEKYLKDMIRKVEGVE